MQSQFYGIFLVLCVLVVNSVIPGVGTYLLTRRDVRGRGPVLAAVVCGVLTGVSSWFAPFFPVLVFIGTAVVYLIARRLVRVGAALAVSAIVLVGGLVFSELVMIAGLNSMR